jgi:hypothetical protein
MSPRCQWNKLEGLICANVGESGVLRRNEPSGFGRLTYENLRVIDTRPHFPGAGTHREGIQQRDGLEVPPQTLSAGRKACDQKSAGNPMVITDSGVFPWSDIENQGLVFFCCALDVKTTSKAM